MRGIFYALISRPILCLNPHTRRHTIYEDGVVAVNSVKCGLGLHDVWMHASGTMRLGLGWM